MYPLRPDVVMTALAMPAEDKVWLVTQLRARGERVPVIAATGQVSVFRHDSSAAHFAQVLETPIDPWRLAQAVASVV